VPCRVDEIGMQDAFEVCDALARGNLEGGAVATLIVQFVQALFILR
jgi:hypothetical protein